MSLRLRLTLTFSVALAIILGATLMTLELWSANRAEGAVEALLKSASQRLLVEARRENPFNLQDFVAEERAFSPEPLAIAIFDPQGNLMRVSGPEILHPDAPGANWKVQKVTNRGYTFRIGINWYQTRLALRRESQNLMGLGFFLWLISSVASWGLVGLTLRPLARLSQEALRRSASREFNELNTPSSDREVINLVTTLNQLLHSVHQGVASRGRFYAAASHELRTPLQAMLGHLELALMRPREAEEYQTALQEIQQQATRLRDLIQALLVLNQLETGSRTNQPERELSEIVERRLAQLSPSQSERVSTHLDGGLRPLPAAYADMLVGNLLDNALKYARPDSPLDVHLSSDSFSITNLADNVDQLDPDKLFEPFYRPDASRSSETGGNGLGLALCKAICESLHWKISLAIQGDRVTARVDFPGKV